MRWEDLPESQNVEDRRGDEGGGYGGGGGFGIPGGGGGLSIGAILLLGIIGYATGIDPSVLIGLGDQFTRQQPQVQQQPNRPTVAPKDDTGRFVARVLGSTEAVWRDVFAKGGRSRPYTPPRLILYNEITRTQCGGAAQAAMGPFYCPSDRSIYLDTSFFRLMERRFKSCDVGSRACQFAQSYVIAHEVGHHVQNELGILARANQAQRGAGSKADANRIQVRVELQADCLAGVWAKHSDQKWNILEPGDIEAALNTATAIGDDALQRSAGRAVVPDSFTHGTSEQRRRWFSAGHQQGTVEACNTFAPTAQF
jgi:predicted metalloprotease